jgi:uncharacterized protein (TIGR02145 family)
MSYKSIINVVSVVVAAMAVMFVGCSGDDNDDSNGNHSVKKEKFTDSRDGKSYYWVEIGTQKWMAENLDYNASGSKCYDNSENNCAKYGRLYNWSTAMNGASSSSLSPSGVQGVCPAGWHIPSDDEWTTLTDYVGGESTAGTKLKSTNEWCCNSNGTDQYGFSALPGGCVYLGGSFYENGYYGRWWSATDYDVSAASYRSMSSFEDVAWDTIDKSYLFSVRCVED